jgi:hypothetical protein
MRSFRIFCLLLALPIFAFAAKSAHAQADPNFEIGLKPYGSYQMGNIDTVSLGNGSLAVDIPLLSYPQRGGKLKLDIDLEYLNGSTYYETPCFPVVGCVLVPYPTPGYFSLIDKGLVSPGSVCSDNESCLAVSESDGAEHAMGAVSGQTNLLETIDGSAYRIETGVPNQVYTSIIDSAGTTYYPSWPVTGCSNPPCTLREDANGNQISYLLLTGWVDTMGRKIPNLTGTGTTNPSDFGGCTGTGTIVSVDIWNPPGVNGGTYPLKLCYVSVTLLGGTTTFTELQSIVLPNGSAWTLTYQELAFGSPYGSYEVPTLSQITFPTGGTISYTWTGTLPCSISTAGEYGNANFAVATRALNPNDGVDPVGTSQYSYSGTPGTATVGSGVLTTIVTDPSGSDTVHTFGLGGCYLYETQTQSYQGLHTTGALLKTVNTTYSYTQANPLYYGQIATLLNLVPTKVVTTLSNGQQSQITHTYDSGFEF